MPRAAVRGIICEAWPEAQDYINVQIRERDKTHIDLTAAKEGKPAELAVTPQTGQVTPDPDKDDKKMARAAGSGIVDKDSRPPMRPFVYRFRTVASNTAV